MTDNVDMRSTRVFHVSLHGLDDKTSVHLQTVFRINFNNKVLISPENSSDIAIFDGDRADFQTSMDQCHSTFPSKSLIYLAQKDLKLNHAVFLRKPGKLDELWNAICQIDFKQNTNGKENTNQVNLVKALDTKNDDDFAPNTPNGLGGTIDGFFDPDKFLVGIIANLIQKNIGSKQFFKINCRPDKLLLYNASQNDFYTNLSAIQLKHLAGWQLDEKFKVSVERLTQEAFFEFALAPYMQTLHGDIFLWNLSLASSRGRLPKGINPNVKLVLNQWPNVTRMTCPMSFLRIASTLSRKPQSCFEIASGLQIPLTDVYSFFSAGYACGYLETSAGGAERQVEHGKRTGMTGLLSALLKKISTQARLQRA